MRSVLLNRLHRVRVRKAHRLAVLCTFVLMLLGPRAFAAAPMCDPSGASIVAPIPALPNATGDLTVPKSCDDTGKGWVDTARTGRDLPQAERVMDPPDRMLGATFTLPRLKGTRLPCPEAIELPHLPGFASSIYRPPRA